MGLTNLLKKFRLSQLVSEALQKPEKLKSSKWWNDFFMTVWGVKELREIIEKMITALQGYKTYIIAVLTGAVTVLYALGKIDEATRDMLLGLLGSGGLATVAAKINRYREK